MRKLIVSLSAALVAMCCLMGGSSALASTRIIAQIIDGHRHHHPMRPCYPRRHWAHHHHRHYRPYYPERHYYR